MLLIGQMFIVLLVIGVILYLVNTYIPMDPRIKSILTTVVVILVVIWVIMTLFNISSPFMR